MKVMNDDFKKKLKSYSEGKLCEDEMKEMDKELEKLKSYQEFLDEQINEDEKSMNEPNYKHEAKIIRKSKWKARFHNALTVICMFFIFTIITAIITAIFYGIGEPDRMEMYRDVIESTIAITQPNIEFRPSGSHSGPYFTFAIEGDLRKRVGGEEIIAGDIKKKFILGKIGYGGIKYTLDKEYNNPLFTYPNSPRDNIMNSDSSILDKLPEGTVAEAYVSFNKFYETHEILKKFENKEVEVLWFAVDTGYYDKDMGIFKPIGFPSHPIWHHDDMIVKNREVKGKFLSKVVTESRSAPTIEQYGSAEIRNENFIKTLELLKEYESIAKNVGSFYKLDIERRLDYIYNNGVKIYGMVITGPSKEILKLKEEEWTTTVRLGEVRLWNWE